MLKEEEPSEIELLRDLDLFEISEFKKWARDNYVPMSEISGVWHPVVQQECVQINKEKSKVCINMSAEKLSTMETHSSPN